MPCKVLQYLKKIIMNMSIPKYETQAIIRNKIMRNKLNIQRMMR